MLCLTIVKMLNFEMGNNKAVICFHEFQPIVKTCGVLAL